MEEINIKDTLKIIPLQVGKGKETVQLVLNGYLDTYNSPEFQTQINSLINSGVQYILFNCNGLNYISSTGIGAFTSFLKLLRQKKGDLVLFGLVSKVLEVFQLLGFTKFFKIAVDFDEALILLKGDGDKANKTQVKKSVFPMVFNCPHCAAKLKTSKEGRFKCSRCKGIVEVDGKGNINTG